MNILFEFLTCPTCHTFYDLGSRDPYSNKFSGEVKCRKCLNLIIASSDYYDYSENLPIRNLLQAYQEKKYPKLLCSICKCNFAKDFNKFTKRFLCPECTRQSDGGSEQIDFELIKSFSINIQIEAKYDYLLLGIKEACKRYIDAEIVFMNDDFAEMLKQFNMVKELMKKEGEEQPQAEGEVTLEKYLSFEFK
ncbi:hypothetical protein FGO68_gene13404 [Halteria grandinella]|uniref:Uncharacterized protein n=1 Tax=Halteria grandinella TaxID=5974 RepID=A0A8J8NMK8_HALGN|nr:hypothetical protein FGO68_gene13404 [Halteria grandinella]